MGLVPNCIVMSVRLECIFQAHQFSCCPDEYAVRILLWICPDGIGELQRIFGSGKDASTGANIEVRVQFLCKGSQNRLHIPHETIHINRKGAFPA